MNYCANTPDKVMRYTDFKVKTRFAYLSRKFKNKVTNILRENPVKTEEAKEKFMHYAEEEGIVIYPKCERHVFDQSSTTFPMAKLDLNKSEDLAAWIAVEGAQQSDCTIVKFFNWLDGSRLKDFNVSVHFESGDEISFTEAWPANVTVSRVRKINLRYIPTTKLPISDKMLVEEVYFKCSSYFESSILQPFLRLKKLIVSGKGDLSLTMLDLPSLEELSLRDCIVLINTENLRELSISYITIDSSFRTFVSQQSRLLVLNVYAVTDAQLLQLPLTLRSLMWWPIPFVEDEEILIDHLAEQCPRLELREFKTNVKLKTIVGLNTQKMSKYYFNGVSREKKHGKWLLKIYDDFDVNLKVMNRKADKCEMYTSDAEALHLIDKATSELTLIWELNGKIEEMPVLSAVTNLTINYEVSEDQSKLLARLLPKFTEAELKMKGKRTELAMLYKN